MATARVRLSGDSLVLRNLKGAMYKMSVEDLPGRIIGMASVDEHIIVSVANNGLHVFRIRGSNITHCGQLAEKTSNCYDLQASPLHIVYIMESDNELRVCVHDAEAVFSKSVVAPASVYKIQRRAPMALLSDVNLLVLGGEAWTTSWTTESTRDKSKLKGQFEVMDLDESHIVLVDLRSCRVLTSWKAVTNSVSILRTQTFNGHCMLGVADSRAGLCVYDMTQPITAAGGGASASTPKYKSLYQVPVDEIRNFQLVGGCVAVFHRFEPNVSFWNMMEQRTILCINIQDQMKELSEEFLEADDDDCGLFTDDDDHVTTVTSISLDDDFLLVYVTMSGCVFGMSVANRLKVFNIPCPHMADAAMTRRNASGIAFLPGGRLVVRYERCGLTLMDFSPENPPPRPPTRCQKRPA